VFARILIVALVTLLGACTTQAARNYCVSHDGRCGAALCSRAGGRDAIAGFSGKHICDVKALDAGKTCAKASDCEGRCNVPDSASTDYPLNKLGECSNSVNYFFGCQPAYLSYEGEWTESICVD